MHVLNSKVRGFVIGCGVVYGMGEGSLFEHFKKSLGQEEKVKVIGAGTNVIPTIHVDDVCQIAAEIGFN